MLLVAPVIAAPTQDRYTKAKWNPNTVNTDGYSFYCSPSVGDFSTPALDAPGITTSEINLDDLWCMSSDGDYFLAVTAYWTDPDDGIRKESGAAAWVPVKISGGKIPIGGIPDVPSGLKLKAKWPLK